MDGPVAAGIKRDERGRPVAQDGYPTAGLASVREVASASSLSVGQIYAMINAGQLPSKRFGRSVRVPWAAVRKSFLGNDA